MKILIYSDVHGNLPAMESMIRKAGQTDGSICLGDLVNYAPWSNECVDLALTLPNPVILKGNHEEAFIQGKYPGNNPLVMDFFNCCYPGFNRFRQIEEFRDEYQWNNIKFRHTINNAYFYPDSVTELDADYVIGHSHHQFSYRNNNYTLWNAGSVGQNRKYINVINFLIYDSVKNVMLPQAHTYDVDMVINEMKIRKYPSSCIGYFQNKERA